MKQRIITGILAALLFVSITFIGGYLFYISVSVLAMVALIELLKMRHISYRSEAAITSLILIFLLVMPDEVFSLITTNPIKINMIIIGMFLLLTLTVITKNRLTFEQVGFVLLAILYVGVGFLYLNETRALSQGLSTIFFVLFLIWATDTGAYFIGKSIGKRKLWPVISPNKTIEGSIGGIFCAIVVGSVFEAIIPIFGSILYAVFISVIIAVLGQIGDLVESALKRHYNVKDSGSILPGHGGILDRFDSLLFVLPILHILNLIS
jgi:phosphatidate cytidylyltransferase